jgi:hypothetical protein
MALRHLWRLHILYQLRGSTGDLEFALELGDPLSGGYRTCSFTAWETGLEPLVDTVLTASWIVSVLVQIWSDVGDLPAGIAPIAGRGT